MRAKTVINLSRGGEDAEGVTVALLVGTSALARGGEVATFLTKEAVRVALGGYSEGIPSPGAPPIAALLREYLDGGGRLFACPISFHARQLHEDELIDGAELAGATPLWRWIGEGATVFSY